MEFHKEDRIIVNPLRVKRWIIDELESNIVLYYTGASRVSAEIIDEQRKNTERGDEIAIEAMHQIKADALYMKDAILKGDIESFTEILGRSWDSKKKMAKSITNSRIENLFFNAFQAGARSGKVSGAGGGGFAIFSVAPQDRVRLVEKLNKLEGKVVNFNFTHGGCHGWKIFK